MSRVWERAIETMPKMILLKLADHANDDGGSIFPGVESVRVAAGAKSDSTVKRRMRQFRQLGVLVEDEARAGPGDADAPRTGRGHRKVWKIDLEALAAVFPLAREVAQPPNLTALARAAGDAPEDGEEGEESDDDEQEPLGSSPRAGSGTEQPGPERGAASPPLAAGKGGLQAPGKGGSQDRKGGPDVAPESSGTIKEASTRASAAPGAPPGGDPGGPPAGPPGEPPNGPPGGASSQPEGDPPVNRHWKAARERFAERRSEAEARAWWDPLIPLRHDDDGTLVVDVPSQFMLDHIRARYSRLMEMALQQAGGGALRFVVEGLAAKVMAARKAKTEQPGGARAGAGARR